MTWTDNDPESPQNWSFFERWRIITVSSAFALIGPISSFMMAPALESIARDLHIPPASPFVRSLTLSIFLLAFTLGAFLVSPLAETCGRRWVLQLSMLEYLVFNNARGFAKTGTQLIVLRFLAGLGGRYVSIPSGYCVGEHLLTAGNNSAPTVVGTGILSDLWTPEERGLSISLYTLFTLLDPSLGPVLGGFITQYSSWRWTFWSISIAGVVIQMMGAWIFRETVAPVLLRRRVQHLRETTRKQALHTK